MAIEEEEEAVANPLRYLITYGDLITLLLIFFIVLYAMSTIQVDKLLVLSDSLKKALHKTSVDSTQVGAALLSDPRRSTKTTAVSEAIKEAIRALGIEKGVTVSENERGTLISLVDSYFFDPGTTNLHVRVQPVLKEIGRFVRETNALVYVEGHTDDIEIYRPPIYSNWELSALRATEVVRFFIKSSKIEPTNLVALGYGPTRPVVENTSAESRARNRRIDIILVNALVRLKKPKVKEPTTLDILGDDKDIKERVNVLKKERKMDRALDNFKEKGTN